MSKDDDVVPYERLIQHFDRPMNAPTDSFDVDALPEQARQLYDTVMADYYSHIPNFTAQSPKEKAKFDLIARSQEHIDELAHEAQRADTDAPEMLGTVETKELSPQEIKKIVGSYKGARPPMPISRHP